MSERFSEDRPLEGDRRSGAPPAEEPGAGHAARSGDEDDLRLVVDAVPALLALVDRKGRYRFNNRLYQEWFGRPHEKLAGCHLREVLGYDAFEEIRDSAATALAGETVSYEREVPYRDGGTRWVSAIYKPFRRRGKVEGFVAVVQDITERRREEREREALLRKEQAARRAAEVAAERSARLQELDRARLEEAERRSSEQLALLGEAERRARHDAEEANRARDDFLGVVSHELRTPLNAIVGWAHLLRDKTGEQALVARGIQVIERNAQAQTRLIEDLLDVSQIISGKLKLRRRLVDPAAVVRRAVEVIQPAADAKEVRLAIRVDGKLPGVVGDPDRLQQIAWNLLSNAVKFTLKGGRVEIALEGGPSDVRIAVSDTGAGIDPAFLPFVFDRFRQADSSAAREHGGLGLGLAIVRHLVELHGGSVRAESAGAGRGATFTVHLPIPAGRAPARPETCAHREDQASVPLSGMRVLVIEDELDAREVTAEMLRSFGAAVHAVGSSDEALEDIDRFGPDVLLADIAMPGEDGFALLRRVRALPSPYARIPAVALTAYAQDDDVRKAIFAGFQAHLAKPVDPTLLSFLLANAVGRELSP